jgi:hypothetical protein
MKRNVSPKFVLSSNRKRCPCFCTVAETCKLEFVRTTNDQCKKRSSFLRYFFARVLADYDKYFYARLLLLYKKYCIEKIL